MNVCRSKLGKEGSTHVSFVLSLTSVNTENIEKGTLEFIYIGIGMPPLTSIHIQLEKINCMAPEALTDRLRELVRQHVLQELENICQ